MNLSIERPDNSRGKPTGVKFLNSELERIHEAHPNGPLVDCWVETWLESYE